MEWMGVPWQGCLAGWNDIVRVKLTLVGMVEHCFLAAVFLPMGNTPSVRLPEARFRNAIT